MEKQDQWKEVLIKFRRILLETELVETIKWGIHVYTIHDKNVVGRGAFKSYVGIWFFQGSFLSDPYKLLVNAQDGRTKGMRQLRFSSIDNIDEDLIRLYVAEAIQNQKDGKEIKPNRTKAVIIPALLKAKLEGDDKLNETFERLTIEKRREFAEYIDSAKRDKTKIKRLENILPMIYQGIGLNDKYK